MYINPIMLFVLFLLMILIIIWIGSLYEHIQEIKKEKSDLATKLKVFKNEIEIEIQYHSDLYNNTKNEEQASNSKYVVKILISLKNSLTNILS